MIIQGVTLNSTRVVDAGVMPTGLILYLDANNSSSYSGTGTTVNDLSGNGYTHTLSNSNLYTVLGGVKCFNCSNNGQVILAMSQSTIPIATNFTYISWTRVRSTTTGYRTLFRSGGTGGHAILVSAGTNTLGMWDNLPGNTGFNSSGYNMASYGNVWAQFATVGDASGQTFYINGQQVGSAVSKSVSGQYHYAWGNIQSANDQPFGYVANLELYNRKLTQEQIQQNFYYYKGTFGV
jgi:Concanavalin A-like lectin/glucanases superfamily